MNKKEEILKLYFEKNEAQKKIARELNVSQSYISQVVQSDSRLQSKKQKSSDMSKQKKKEYNRRYFKNYSRKKSNNLQEYQKLQFLLLQDSKELSYKPQMSDIAFAKWNRSAFTYDNHSSDLVLKRALNVTNDVPRRVKNVVSASSIKEQKVY